MKKINIIIPCFNEEESLPKLFNELESLDKMLQQNYKTTFTFVDDGSKDKTHELLEKNKSRLTSTTILKHGKNKISEEH